MKKISFLFTFFFISALCLSLQAQSEAVLHVTFILTSPDLPSDTSVYITGSVEQLGSWNPDKVKMEPKGDHTWTKEISISRPVSIEYKYTLGHGNVKARMRTDLPSRILSLTYRRTRPLKTQCSSGPKMRRYPVVYMHDGQNIFDPVIVVGIYNTSDRMKGACTITLCDLRLGDLCVKVRREPYLTQRTQRRRERRETRQEGFSTLRAKPDEGEVIATIHGN